MDRLEKQNTKKNSKLQFLLNICNHSDFSKPKPYKIIVVGDSGNIIYQV